jgi:spore coat polysaccharide biosynthesis protein SpsF
MKDFLLEEIVPKRPAGNYPCILIQARMGSTRLPGKVLLPLGKRSMLAFLLKRLRSLSLPIIVATTLLEKDDAIVRCGKECGVSIFRGSEEDVLDRFYKVAGKFETIIRITADCPLTDPDIIIKALDLFYHLKVDYLSNTLNRTYPRGLDVEIFSFKALEKAATEASSLYDREHVTSYITSHPDQFHLANFIDSEDMHEWRLTVDTKEDLELVRKVVESEPGSYLQLKEILKQNPEWKKVNKRIQQKG